MNVPEILVNARAAPSPPRADPTPDEGECSFQESLENKVQSGQDSKVKIIEKRTDEAQAGPTGQKEAEEKKDETSVIAPTVVIVPFQLIPIPMAVVQDEKQSTGTVACPVQPVLQPGQDASQNLIEATQAQIQANQQKGESSPAFQAALLSKMNSTIQPGTEQVKIPESPGTPLANPTLEKAAGEALKNIQASGGVKVDSVQESTNLEMADAKLVLIDAETQTYAVSQAITAKIGASDNTRTPQVIQQVSQGVQEMLHLDKQTIRLQIYPEDLGRIDVKLVSGSDGLQVILNADKASTNRMLQDSLEQLQRSLLDAGVKVGGMSVGSQGAQENNAWQYKPQHAAFSFDQSAIMNEPVEAISRWNLPGMMSTLDARA